MYNKVILIGNLTRDVELRYTPQGTAVASFGIAVNRKYGEGKEEVYFGDCIAWGKLAETCSKYLNKGSRVLVDGRLTTRSWSDNSGNKKSKTEIVVEQVRFLSNKGKNQEAGSDVPEERSEPEPF